MLLVWKPLINLLYSIFCNEFTTYFPFFILWLDIFIFLLLNLPIFKEDKICPLLTWLTIISKGVFFGNVANCYFIIPISVLLLFSIAGYLVFNFFFSLMFYLLLWPFWGYLWVIIDSALSTSSWPSPKRNFVSEWSMIYLTSSIRQSWKKSNIS